MNINRRCISKYRWNGKKYDDCDDCDDDNFDDDGYDDEEEKKK